MNKYKAIFNIPLPWTSDETLSEFWVEATDSIAAEQAAKQDLVIGKYFVKLLEEA